jgi:hypothetical protein
LEARWDRAAALWPTSQTLTVTSSSLFLVMGNEAVTLQVAPHENTLLEVRNGGGGGGPADTRCDGGRRAVDRRHHP